VLLRELVEASRAVGATHSRRDKVALLADVLRRLGPDEVAPGVAFLSGELRQRQIGVGWASLREAPPSAPEPTLSVGEVDSAFERVGRLAGPGSRGERAHALQALLGRATEPEQIWLRGLLTGELRQGALAALVEEGAARAAAVPSAALRRAVMLGGDRGAVVAAAIAQGVDGLACFRLEVGRPIQPMLASPADGVEAALERTGPAGVEPKLDGARVQVHRSGDDIGVFTRSLDDVTARVPEVVEAARGLGARALVLDGEALAVRPDGRPEPFQVTAGRFGTRTGRVAPLSAFFFDLLHLDGQDLLDRPGRERARALAQAVPAGLRVARKEVGDAARAAELLEEALRQGHEGVMVKSLEAPYEAGRRGRSWLKVKPRHTLDLVVLAAEWGHGRRRGWLSNLHLGARAPAGDGWVMLGKTFKGLTDAMLAWQTERLLELAVNRGDWVVHVRPELVVEVAFDGVQTSTRYPGGVALRFARVLRHRPDKPAREADGLEAVLALR
jgi:DNA ligase-1